MSITFVTAISTWGILGIIFGVAAVVLAVLYFFGRKMQKKQAEAQEQIDSSKQLASILVIDKKKLKPKDSGLPQVALGQLPWYAKNQKLPIVKAKIGPQIMTLMCDAEVFEILPVKKECKVYAIAAKSMPVTQSSWELTYCEQGFAPEEWLSE